MRMVLARKQEAGKMAVQRRREGKFILFYWGMLREYFIKK